MTGQTPIEQSLETGDGVEDATPTSTEQEIPSEADKLTKVEKELAKVVKMVGALQSDKDKAAFRAESLSQANAREIERLGKLLGKSPEEIQAAQRQAVLEDVVSERLAGNQNSQSTGVSTPAPVETSVDLASIDLALGLPSNDSRVTQLKIKYGSNVGTYTIEAAKLKQSFNQTQTTPAEMPLPTGSTVTQKTYVSGLIAELQELQRKPSVNRERIKVLTAELDARGWK